MVSGMVCQLFLNKTTEKECLGAIRMTQWIKASGAKPDDLSSIPQVPYNGENGFTASFLMSTSTPTYTHYTY